MAHAMRDASSDDYGIVIPTFIALALLVALGFAMA